MKKLTEAEKKEIVKNILGAADKKKQIGIEADLHCISKGDVKEILKAEGVNLRIFNGGRHDKKHIEDGLIEEQAQEPVNELDTTEQAAEQEDYREETYTEEKIGQQWADIALPPLSDEERVCEPRILTDVQDIPHAEELLLSSGNDKNAADSAKCGKDALVIGTYILEENAVFDAIKEKVDQMRNRRRELVAEIGSIDTYLKRYAFFYEDLYNDISGEGVEI